MTISTTTRRLTGSLRTFVLSVVLLIGLSPGGVMASAVDEYTQFQLLIDQDLGGPEVSASVSDLTTILGEERDLNVNSVDGLVPDSSRSVVLVNEGVLSFSSDSNVVGMAIAQWDGVDGVTQLPPVLPQFGLNTDLTQGGTVDALEYDVLAADKTFSYRIEAYTDTDHYSRMTLQQSAIAGDPVTVTLPYQDFLDCDNVDVVCGPGGPVDFEQLGALQLLLNTDPVSALDMSMSPITTVLTGARLGDFVWEDCNGNGLQDDAATLGCDGGAGIPGVTVNLLTPGVDGVCGTDDEQEAFPGATMPTDADGIYLFTGLDAGNYCVEFVRPAGFECTLANQGMDNAKDSDVVDQGDGTCQTVDPDQNPIALGESEIDRSWDAGLVRPASLGDRVWNDLNPNNVQDPGDADLAGTRVTLLDCDGNRITEDLFGSPVGPITTDDTGFYEFINLRPGSYQVSFQPPAGFTFVTPKVGTDDTIDSDAVLQGDGTGLTACTTLVSGENNPNIDAGLVETAESRLGDLVWNDLNADGIQDDINGTPDGEPGIEGVTVELWQCADGSPTDDTGRTETTNASGFYVFENLTAGSYAVRFPVDMMEAAGWKVSPQNQGADESIDSDADPVSGFTACVELGEADENLDLDAGFYKPAMLGDRVWNDLVRNNVQDAGDADLAGTVVTLEDCSGIPVTADVDGNPINPITTGADGSYKFTNLAPGDYQVRFAPAAGFTFVTPKVGTDDTSDSDAVPQGDGTGLSACTTLVSGENNPDIDAGLFEIATSRLGDLVWNDLNADGIQDNINGDPNGEPGIPGVEVELWQCDAQGNPTTDTGSIATTNASGFYIFINLTAGNYAVRFPVGSMMAEGWKVSPQNQGVDDSIDSDADPTTGFTACVALGEADENLDLDAGFFKPASLGDFVWDDDSVNRNDIQDPNEAGVAGTLVTLEDCSGTPVTVDADGGTVDPINTGADGAYGFTNLLPGDYQVRFAPPTDYEFVTANAGAPNVDSDAIPQQDGTGLTACTTLISGENNPDIDAGLFLPVAECGECDGKVTELTLRYNGTTPAQVRVEQKKDGTVFDEMVNPGDTFTFSGSDKKGTLGTEISIYVDDSLNAKIHTSCSQPIGPGLVAGDFTVIEGYSLNGGLLCPIQPPVQACGCEGKVTELTLQYNGDTPAQVRVAQKKGGVVFDQVVPAGGTFTFDGTDKNGTLGTEISIYVDGSLNAKIHTSCSKPIGPGLVAGDFLVTDGSSLKIPELCPVDQPPEPPVGGDCGCDGKVTELTLQYNGLNAAWVEVVEKKGGTVFSDTLGPNEEFTFSGTDKNGTLGTEISIYVDGELNATIHTSCSQPIGPGLIAGDFMVIDGSSLKVPELCPVDQPPEPPVGGDCGCDGKVTELTLQYNGDTPAQVRVEQKKEGVVFDQVVPAGGTFSFSGTDKKDTLGTEISLYLGGELNATIHTSCSRPIGPGLVAGDFEVIDGSSRNIDNLCPLN